MGRPELGTKCTCSGCHERFYDLNRSAPICPKCGILWSLETPRASRPTRECQPDFMPWSLSEQARASALSGDFSFPSVAQPAFITISLREYDDCSV